MRQLKLRRQYERLDVIDVGCFISYLILAEVPLEDHYRLCTFDDIEDHPSIVLDVSDDDLRVILLLGSI